MKTFILTTFIFVSFIFSNKVYSQSQLIPFEETEGKKIPVLQNITSTSMNFLIYIEITNDIGIVKFKGTTETEITKAEGKKYYIISVPGSANIELLVVSSKAAGNFQIIQVLK